MHGKSNYTPSRPIPFPTERAFTSRVATPGYRACIAVVLLFEPNDKS
jgi:hypothetical protein